MMELKTIARALRSVKTVTMIYASGYLGTSKSDLQYTTTQFSFSEKTIYKTVLRNI